MSGEVATRNREGLLRWIVAGLAVWVLSKQSFAANQAVERLTQALQAAAPAELPLGLGKLTYETLEREICCWKHQR